MVISGWWKAPSIVIFFKVSKDLKNKKIRCLRNWTKPSTPIENIPAMKKLWTPQVMQWPPTNAGRCGFGPRVRKISWRRKWHPTPVFLLGKFQGQRSLVSDSPWGHKESDMTQQMSTHAHTSKLHFVCLQTQFQGSLWHKVFLFIPVKHVRW